MFQFFEQCANEVANNAFCFPISTGREPIAASLGRMNFRISLTDNP